MFNKFPFFRIWCCHRNFLPWCLLPSVCDTQRNNHRQKTYNILKNGPCKHTKKTPQLAEAPLFFSLSCDVLSF